MVLLGSTGSIGTSSLEIIEKFKLQVEVLTANKNIELLNKQIKKFKPKRVVVGCKSLVSKVNHKDVLCGQDGIKKAIQESKSNMVINAIVGFSGLASTLEAIKLDKLVALANKESLVVAGKFIDVGKIIPIDSEHFGLKYLMQDKKIDKIIITASGGALRDYSINELNSVKLEDVLKHPNWDMGNRITIDSATMVNKIFEAIEAKWLFNIDNIDAVIEKKSLIHSIIDFVDGSTTLYMAKADMRLPIAYAILGKVENRVLESLDLTKVENLKFSPINLQKYPIWSIKESILKNPDLGVVINAADEMAVMYFSKRKIGFNTICKIILRAYEKFQDISLSAISSVYETDKEVRAFIKKDVLANIY